MNKYSASATSYTVSLLNRTKLTPVTETELTEYCFNLLYTLNDLATLANDCHHSEHFSHWSGSEEDVQHVHKSYAWKLLNRFWNYAEHGIAAHNYSPSAIDDDMEHFFKLTSAAEGTLYFNGSLLNESLNVSMVPAKLALKYFARLKLDTNWNLDSECCSLSLYPHVHETHLTTIEYALLAGFSHVGAVRNESCNKQSPLLTEKEGKNVIISIGEARRKLQNKRRFIPSPGVKYD